MVINYFDGRSRSDIYGVGFVELWNANKWKGMIIHYDGSSWQFVDVPETRSSFETVAVDQSDGMLFMSATDYETSGYIAKIYSWDGKELIELFSDFGWSFVTKLGNEIYATHGMKIYKYKNKSLTLWQDNTNTGIEGNIICGRSKNDFFIRKPDEGIVHFNGEDYKIVYKTELVVQRGITFKNDVFFIGKDYINHKNYIIHGTMSK